EGFSQNDFDSKIQALTLENEDLKKNLSRFEKGKNIFQENHKNFPISNCSNKRCFYCCRRGHIVPNCPFKKKHTSKWRWVPKGTFSCGTNPIGPKEIWVPRTNV